MVTCLFKTIPLCGYIMTRITTQDNLVTISDSHIIHDIVEY